MIDPGYYQAGFLALGYDPVSWASFPLQVAGRLGTQIYYLEITEEKMRGWLIANRTG